MHDFLKRKLHMSYDLNKIVGIELIGFLLSLALYTNLATSSENIHLILFYQSYTSSLSKCLNRNLETPHKSPCISFSRQQKSDVTEGQKTSRFLSVASPGPALISWN